ncbi:MAG: glycosyltransferase [Minisyncoccia bacterium]
MPEEKPKISIILPTHTNTYRRLQYLKESIGSCLNQTYKDFELIIVDDCSIIDIKKTIENYKDSRIKYIRNDKNLGLPNSLNKGFSCARGDYFTWTSDDNKFAQNALKIMLDFLERNPQVDFVYSNYYRIDEDGKIIGKTRVKNSKSLEIGDYIGACFLYKRKIFELIGGYDDTYKLAEDYEYWLRVRKKFKMQKINDFLYYYRVHNESLTNLYKREVITQSQKASWEYISKWARYYHQGLVLFFTKKYKDALKMFIISAFLNPLNIRSYYKMFQIFIKILLGFFNKEEE